MSDPFTLHLEKCWMCRETGNTFCGIGIALMEGKDPGAVKTAQYKPTPYDVLAGVEVKSIGHDFFTYEAGAGLSSSQLLEKLVDMGIGMGFPKTALVGGTPWSKQNSWEEYGKSLPAEPLPAYSKAEPALMDHWKDAILGAFQLKPEDLKLENLTYTNKFASYAKNLTFSLMPTGHKPSKPALQQIKIRDDVPVYVHYDYADLEKKVFMAMAPPAELECPACAAGLKKVLKK